MLVSIHKPTSAFLFFLFIISIPTKAQIWTLEQCIDTALVHNKSLQIKKNEIRMGIEKQKESKSNLLPKVFAGVEYKYFTDLPYQLMPLSVFGGQEGQFKEAQFGVPHNISANLKITMPLYNAQISGGIKAARIGTEIKTLQYQKAEEDLRYEISILYYNAQLLNKQLNFIDSNLVNSLKLLKNIQLLKEQALARETDVLKLELQIQQLETQRLLTSNKYIQVLNALKLLMGIPSDTELEIITAIDIHHSNSRHSSQTIIDIKIAKKQQHFLANEKAILKKTRLPSVSVFASYGTTGYGFDSEHNSFLNFYPIGLAGLKINYPLFNGTITKRKINQKEIELHNSDLKIKWISDKNKLDIENATLQVEAAKNVAITGEAQIHMAQLILQQTLLQQKQGLASLTDVLLADNTLREAQQNYLSAVIDFLKAEIKLIKVNGGINKTFD